MDVCQLCQKLRPPTANEPLPACFIAHPRVEHHKSLSELQTSSMTCSLCRLILSRIDLSLADRLPPWVKDYLSNASIVVLHDRSQKLDQATIISPRLCFTGPDEWKLTPPSPLEYSGYLLDSAGEGYTIYSTDWKYYLLSSLAAVDDRNERYIARALWDVDKSRQLHERLRFAYIELQNCISNHEICRGFSSSLPEDPPPLPTRVIDVWYPSKNNNAQAQLIRSNGLKAHYTALSYCWGGGKTDESTIQELKQGVEPSKLAKTYEDAIYVTRALGMRYLWIDALCIMQNDPAEVESEMAAMAKIYHNAQVSISASASTSLHGGCVYPLEPPLCVEFSVDYKVPSKKQKAYIRSAPRYRQNVLRSPLTTRGWTLQEDLIPLRTLYCAGDQMYWQCRQRTVTEDGVIDNDMFSYYETHYDDEKYTHHRSYIDSLKGMTHRLRGHQGWRDKVKKRDEFDLELWLQVINDFTARNLKYPEDRLRAIAGLISDKGDNEEDNLAGLWREDLRFGLWWRAYPSSRDLNLPSLGIPSWSWISFNGRINYEDNGRTTASRRRIWGFFDVVDIIMQWSGKPLSSTLRQATLELNSSLQPLSVDVREPGHAVKITRSSEVDTGFRARISSCTGTSVRFFDRFDHFSSGSTHRPRNAAELDRMLDEDTTVIYAMHLSSYCGDKLNERHSPWRPQDVTFLLVEPTGRMKDEYRRIGLGRVSPKLGLFEGVSKRRITLV